MSLVHGVSTAMKPGKWSYQSKKRTGHVLYIIPPCHGTESVLLQHLTKLKTGYSHWAFMMVICFWEATFSYKSYHLSDCYRLYISCKNNIGKALNYQTDLSDWYQLYISCKIYIEISITLSNRYEPIRSIFYKTDDGHSCNHADWGVVLTQIKLECTCCVPKVYVQCRLNVGCIVF